MTQSSYDSWLWFQLNPDETPQRHRNTQRGEREPDEYDRKRDAENLAILKMTEQERRDADTDHLEKHGIYF